jgi:hypothetical protein
MDRWKAAQRTNAPMTLARRDNPEATTKIRQLRHLARNPTASHLQSVTGGEVIVPNKSTVEAAKKDLREGKSASTAAGEFVHEEIEHVREGKHGASSPQQAIAIGLSKARRAGVPLKPPAPGKTSEATRKRSEHDYEKGQSEPKTREDGSTKRGRARVAALKREPKSTASHSALSQQAKRSARRRGQTVHKTA